MASPRFLRSRRKIEIEPLAGIEDLNPEVAREILKELNEATARLQRTVAQAEAVNRSLGRNIEKAQALEKRPRR